ncbi:hypothetical protein [Neokomagataea thailandica]|nr:MULTISPECIES: hypothetical protein [Neokomagataea]
MTTVNDKTYGNSDNPVVVSGDTYNNITLNTNHGKDYSGSPKFTVRGGTVNGLTVNNGSYVNIYGGSVSSVSINNGGFFRILAAPRLAM